MSANTSQDGSALLPATLSASGTIGTPASGGEADLLAWERRALFEDIGRIGLTLGKDLTPDSVVPLCPTGSDALSGPDTATPFERLRMLAALWPRIETVLRAIVQRPDSRITVEAASVLPSQSHGGLSASRSVARTPGGLAS